MIQGVRDVFEIVDVSPSKNKNLPDQQDHVGEESRIGKMVLIGQGLAASLPVERSLQYAIL